MGALQRLYLSSNELTGVPSSIGSLSNLRELYLDNNQLTGTLPNSFVGLSHISDFYINNNNLTNLFDGFTNLTSIASQHANISNNCLNIVGPAPLLYFLRDRDIPYTQKSCGNVSVVLTTGACMDAQPAVQSECVALVDLWNSTNGN